MHNVIASHSHFSRRGLKDYLIGKVEFIQLEFPLKMRMSTDLDYLPEGLLNELVNKIYSLALTPELKSFFDVDAFEMSFSLPSKSFLQKRIFHSNPSLLFNVQKDDIMWIASFLKHIARYYGPLRIYPYSMGKNGLLSGNNAFLPPVQDESIYKYDSSFQNGVLRQRKFYVLEYDEMTNGFKDFSAEDFKRLLGGLFADLQTLIFRSDRLLDEKEGKKITFGLNIFTGELLPIDIVGSTSVSGATPVGPNEQLSWEDGIDYNRLNVIWKSFMIKKSVYPLVRTSYVDWMDFMKDIPWLNDDPNGDLANVGHLDRDFLFFYY